jgi:chromatin modification-related protein EAF6
VCCCFPIFLTGFVLVPIFFSFWIVHERVLEGIKTPEAAREELGKLLEEKSNLETKLKSLEKQIFQLEGSYLTETKHLGNILTGWDSYLSSRSGALRRPMKFKDSDRLFSLSSATALPLEKEEAEEKSKSKEPPKKRQKKATTKASSRKAGPGRPRKSAGTG